MKNLLLTSGKIYTLNPQQPTAEAVAIGDSRIIAVGRNSDVGNLGKSEFKVIDLQGKTVIPGLIDSHTHFLAFAHLLRRVNLRGINSFEEIISTLRSFSGRLKPDQWLVGGGWDKNILGHKAVFNRKTLDEIRPNEPVALQSKDQHVLWVNSKTLEIVGIDKTTGDPQGGKIERDPNTGEPTGILKENACNLVWNKVPPYSMADSKEMLKEAMKIANGYGLTGVQNHDDPGAFELFRQLKADGQSTLRTCFWIPIQELDSAISSGLISGCGDEFVRFGGVKMYADGSLGSQTALMFEPFEGSEDNIGVEATSQERLTENSIIAGNAGIGVSIHAIGDRAVHQALNTIEYSMSRIKDKTNLRPRIEHVQILHPQDVDRFAKLGIIASVQPVHAPADMDIADKYWGKRARLSYASNTLLKSGAKVVFGSDAPIESIDPWLGIHAAVCRKRIGDKESWYPQEKVTITEAVSGFTRWAAYASYEENLKGTIEVGKLADMLVLSQDIFRIDPELIPDTKVEFTILGGKVVFER